MVSCVAAAVVLTAVAGCSSSTATSSSPAGAVEAASITDAVALYHPGLPGVKISVFAHFAAGTANYRNPDSIAIDGSTVFIGFQNVTAKDCSDGKTSTIVQYTMAGTVVKQYKVPGHNDGLRVDPSTHLLWATSCEDGNPALSVIDPSSGTITPYTFPAAPHGGGYDDVCFMNGSAFIAASNPTLDASGNNVFPAVDKITLSGSSAVLTPILMGNATATDTIAGGTTTLNENDPDSFSVDGQGELVLIDQGASEIVFIKNPGTPQQTVSRTPVGNQLDDTVWTTSGHGRLLITDGTSNTIYWVHVNSSAGTIYTEAPNDSGVTGFIGTVDLTTDFIHPVMIGFGHPTGMAYVPDAAP
jgi:sugar lactone lactonase YvrE